MPLVSVHSLYNINSSSVFTTISAGLGHFLYQFPWRLNSSLGLDEVSLGVAVCTCGACDDDTDLSLGDVGSATSYFGMAGLGLVGSTAGGMNLWFLVYQAPKLVWTC